MMSFRVTRGKRIALAAAAVVLVAALGIRGVQQFREASVPAGTAAAESAQPISSKKASAKTNEQRLAFLKSYGWEVEEEAAEIMEVIIPKEFDSVYTSYNSMQKKQGYDLEKLAGKRCKRYSYVVLNYPGASGEVRINLLVKDGKVVGGDVCSLEPLGFMHGFAKVV